MSKVWQQHICRQMKFNCCYHSEILLAATTGRHSAAADVTADTRSASFSIATVTLGVFGDSASSPWPQSRRAGWPSFGLPTDHIPPSLSPIAITRVSSLASFNILILFVQASHVIHLGAPTNIWNNLPQFPISYTATLSPILFFRLPSTILKF